MCLKESNYPRLLKIGSNFDFSIREFNLIFVISPYGAVLNQVH
jgi:hypothetical protein